MGWLLQQTAVTVVPYFAQATSVLPNNALIGRGVLPEAKPTAGRHACGCQGAPTTHRNRHQA
jgi:hypothetical protein